MVHIELFNLLLSMIFNEILFKDYSLNTDFLSVKKKKKNVSEFFTF